MAFGKASGYDPCKESTNAVDQKTADVELMGHPPLSVASQSNPAEARIQWTVASSKSRAAKVALYSVSGRLVKRWEPVALVQGITKLTWDGSDDTGSKASAGVYYLEVTSEDGYRVVTKAVLVSR